MLAILAIGVPLLIATATVGFGAKGGVMVARGVLCLGAFALALWFVIIVGAAIAYNTAPACPAPIQDGKWHLSPLC